MAKYKPRKDEVDQWIIDLQNTKQRMIEEGTPIPESDLRVHPSRQHVTKDNDGKEKHGEREESSFTLAELIELQKSLK